MLSIYEKDVLDGLKGLSKGKDKMISSLPKVKIVPPESDGDSSYLDSFLDRVNSIDSRNVKLMHQLLIQHFNAQQLHIEMPIICKNKSKSRSLHKMALE